MSKGTLPRSNPMTTTETSTSTSLVDLPAPPQGAAKGATDAESS